MDDGICRRPRPEFVESHITVEDAMAKSQTGSVAPKERINIVYKPATGNRRDTVELPLKLLVLGDFSRQADDRAIEEREPLAIDKDNFDEVMGSMKLSVESSVPNRLSGEGELALNIGFKKLKDFSPDQVLQAVPELKQMMELREALKALKGPLGNVPAMRKTIQEIFQDEAKSKKLMAELGLN